MAIASYAPPNKARTPLSRQPGAVAGTAANPSPNPIGSMPGSPAARRAVGDTRPRYQTGQYPEGSFGDTNARQNAGIYYDDEGFAASNAAGNRTGIVVPRGTRFLRPTTGLPIPEETPERKLPQVPVSTRDPNRPNLGGTITRGGTVLRYGPSDPRNLNSLRQNQGGTITKGGKTFNYAPSPYDAALSTPAVDVNSPTTQAAPQTEARNPLTGTSNQQVQGTTQPINPGTALGFNRAGTTLQRGQDARPYTNLTPGMPQPNQQGGTPMIGGGVSQPVGRPQTNLAPGLFSKQFGSPAAASAYDNYVKKLFR